MGKLQTLLKDFTNDPYIQHHKNNIINYNKEESSTDIKTRSELITNYLRLKENVTTPKRNLSKKKSNSNIISISSNLVTRKIKKK